MAKQVFRTFSYWIPLAIVATILVFTIYAVEQQALRQSGNDPQIQLAEDAATLMQKDIRPELVVPFTETIDISKSVQPFVIIYDESGMPIASNAALNDEIPVPPVGVFDYVRRHGEDRITWQPEKNVRLATIMTNYSNGSTTGFVLAGRSLREVEVREDMLLMYILISWFASLLSSLVAIAVFQQVARKAVDMDSK